MKRARPINKLPFLVLLFSPLLSGADLSTYRGFQFGMSLNAAVKHSGMDTSEVTMIHERPARIQQLSWRPVRFFSSDTDPVEQVLFSFYNGQLFRIVVNYDTEKTNGLTSADIIDAISAKYGTPTKPGVAVVLASQFSDDTVQVIARWEDAEYSFNLVQLPYGSAFKLLILSKGLNALADAALAEGIRLDGQEAPQREKIKEQNAQSELDKARLVNKEHFRP
jgi:hypothetical protein